MYREELALHADAAGHGFPLRPARISPSEPLCYTCTAAALTGGLNGGQWVISCLAGRVAAGSVRPHVQLVAELTPCCCFSQICRTNKRIGLRRHVDMHLLVPWQFVCAQDRQ